MSAESAATSEHAHHHLLAGPHYAPHRPEQTLLYRTIREQLESFLAQERRAFLRFGAATFIQRNSARRSI